MEEWEKQDSESCSLAEFCTSADLFGTIFTNIEEESVALSSM